MREKEQYKMYPAVPKSEEVRACLKETRAEVVAQGNFAYQYDVVCHPFDMEAPAAGSDGEGAACDPVYPLCCMRGESAERAFFRAEARWAFYRAMAGLEEVQRRRLELHFYEGLSFTEIARIEGVTEGAVRHQIKRTLRSLRQELTEQGFSKSDLIAEPQYDFTNYRTRNSRESTKKAPRTGTGGSNAARFFIFFQKNSVRIGRFFKDMNRGIFSQTYIAPARYISCGF